MSLSSALQNLRLPSLHHTINSAEDSSQDPNLTEWKSNALSTLKQLQELLAENDLACLKQDDIASVVAITVPLTNGDNLATEPIQDIAHGMRFLHSLACNL
jgi:hypothetical protein